MLKVFYLLHIVLFAIHSFSLKIEAIGLSQTIQHQHAVITKSFCTTGGVDNDMAKRNRPITQKKHETDPPALDQTGREISHQQTGKTPTKAIRLDELGDKQIQIYAENCQLANLMKNDVPAREAIKRLGISRTERTARNLFKRFKEGGFPALLDKRWGREFEAKVFTFEVQKVTLAWYFARPAAGPRAIWKKVCEECKKREIKGPCESSVKKYLARLDESLKLARDGKVGIREWEKQASSVIRYENTTYANELWQGDHSQLNIWVKVKINGEWKPFRVYITLLLDAHTRTIMAYVISTKHPDSWVIALTFRRAILPKDGSNLCGIPTRFESDRGSDFLSYAIAATLSHLHCDPEPDPPRYPNDKGKIEIIFRTIDSGCLRILPGHMDAVGVTEQAALKRVHEFYTLRQLDKEIARWIDEDYHRREHSETGREPLKFWESTKRLRLPESEDDLNLLILKYDKVCTVLNTGIKFKLNGVRHRFWSPELAYHWKRKVCIRYNPEDMDSVLIYCAATGEFLCEGFDMQAESSRYTIEDIKRTRSQFRRGLIERTKDYMSEVYENDRKLAERMEREEARRAEEAKASEESAFLTDHSGEDKSGELQRLMEEFKRQDSGEDEYLN
jgi:putative transposase